MTLSSKIVLTTGLVGPALALLVGAYVHAVSLALPMHFV
jgi:hypothetical protein